VLKIRENISGPLMWLLFIGCTPVVEDRYADEDRFTDSGSAVAVSNLADTTELTTPPVRGTNAFLSGNGIETKNVPPGAVVAFAQTLIGTPYKYGSTDPKAGFDCSGFITYVFNHFDIAVPRSSVDFTNVGKEVSKIDARPGDLVLFTGTNPSIRKVGHMGIVTFNRPDTLFFIHSTSGKLHSVTITPLNEYYQSRFVKIVRIFPENDKPDPLQ
jgi:cell wall-associated NlpC family hydrolase